MQILPRNFCSISGKKISFQPWESSFHCTYIWFPLFIQNHRMGKGCTYTRKLNHARAYSQALFYYCVLKLQEQTLIFGLWQVSLPKDSWILLTQAIWSHPVFKTQRYYLFLFPKIQSGIHIWGWGVSST